MVEREKTGPAPDEHRLPASAFAELRAALACFLVLSTAFFAAGPAAGDEAQPLPPVDFRLDFDAGGHRGMIRDIAFTLDGRYLVSASDDKTIRVWDWETGDTIRLIRGFVGDGQDGKVFAIAVSPDGKTVAAGGWFGPGVGADPPYGDIRLFDLSTGKLRAVLPGNQFPVYTVAFSPDGSRLAAGGQDGFVYLWHRDEAFSTGWTPDSKLDAGSEHITKVVFAAGGSRVVATTADYGIRVWDAKTGGIVGLPAETEKLKETSVDALAVSADGLRFATGTADGHVQIWRVGDGALAATLPPRDFGVGSLTFTTDDRLVVSCGARCGAENRSEVWKPGEDQPSLRYAGHDGIVVASARSPDGMSVATAGGSEFAVRIWNPSTGADTKVLQGKGHPVMAVGLARDATAIAWGNLNPCPERQSCTDIFGALESRFLLPSAETFFEPPSALKHDDSSRFRTATHGIGAWSLSTAKGGPFDLDNGVLEIANGRVVTRRIVNDASNGALHSSFTLIADGLRLVTGGADGTLLEYFSATGRQAGEFLDGHTGEINAMVASDAANLLVTGSSDQTIKLWNLKTRELIASLYFAGKEWIVWTPQGYYTSSDDGDKLLGWQVNQGRGTEGRFVRAEQLKRFLNSPEIVRRAIVLRSASRAVAEMRPGVEKQLDQLLQRKPPEFNVRLADDQSNVREGYVAVEITGAKEAGADVADFGILSNSRNVGDFAARSIEGDGDKAIVEVPVTEGQNAISITGTNEYGYLTERSVVALGKRKKTAEAKRGKLYVVVVGVTDYPLLKETCNGRSCDLRYPVADAAEFLRVAAARTAPLYTGMESLVLLNRDTLDEDPERAKAIETLVGADNILEPDSDTISDRVEDFLDKPGPDDTTIVFVAGHGINIGEDYYFIPTDGRRQGEDKWKRSSLVDWRDIQKSLERAEGVRLLLLDTCHAANAFNPRLEKDAADARIVVFSATAANSTALELAELGHGVFTYSLLAGLRGEAKTSKDGVTLFGLADFLSREVSELTQAKQKPFYYVSGVDNMIVAEP